jgi:hypothetical protein
MENPAQNLRAEEKKPAHAFLRSPRCTARPRDPKPKKEGYQDAGADGFPEAKRTEHDADHDRRQSDAA